MSSPILPVHGPLGPPSCTPSESAGEAGMFMAELAMGESTLSIAAARGGPAPELLEQIAAAARVEEMLHASGSRLRFCSGACDERTRIELHDRDGFVRTLSVSEAIELATGEPVR